MWLPLLVAVSAGGGGSQWSISPLTNWWYVYLTIAAIVFGALKPVRNFFKKAGNDSLKWLVGLVMKSRDARVDVLVTRQESICKQVDEIHEALLGRVATDLIPNPEPGILPRLVAAEKNISEVADLARSAVAVGVANGQEIAEIKAEVKKQSPNGGDTNNAGDLILRTARALNQELKNPVEHNA